MLPSPRGLALLIVLATTPAFARTTFYIDPSQVDLVDILAPPPALGSQAQTDDLQAVLAAQAARTEAEIAGAKADVELSVFRFADALGDGFQPDRLPFATLFFERVKSDESLVVATAKARFNRPRPFVASADVKPVVPEPGNASYPSGHTTFAYVDGILLAAMVPEKADAIFARAALYAHRRIVAGVHFPTDIEAGRIAGSVIDNTLLNEPRFRVDFKLARAEIRQALGLKPAGESK